jgi:Na+/H+ antiporter NhaB
MSMLNRDIAGNIEGRHMFLYMLQSLTLAVGLLLYPFIRQTLGIHGKVIKALSVVSGVIYSACILSAGYIDNYTVIIAIMILAPITTGYLVGMVYVRFTQPEY